MQSSCFCDNVHEVVDVRRKFWSISLFDAATKDDAVQSKEATRREYVLMITLMMINNSFNKKETNSHKYVVNNNVCWLHKDPNCVVAAATR